MTRPGTRPGFAGQLPGNTWQRPGGAPTLPGVVSGTRPRPGVNSPGLHYPGRPPIAGTRPVRPITPTLPVPGARPPVVVNRPNLNQITNNVITNNTIFNQVNNVTNVNTNIYGGRYPSTRPYRPWRDPYDHVHNHWHHGYWGFQTIPSFWISSGSGWSSLGSVGWSFRNPYYAAPLNTVAAFNYSRPIVATSANLARPEVTEAAAYRMSEAREAFRLGETAIALDKVNQAIQLVPDDRTLHEFRALCLFARGDYADAAGVIYSVLASGPGWDWDTLAALYPNIDTYTTQVKLLSNYVANRPDRGDARFLLAYHFLTLGYSDAAIEQLEAVVRIQPGDRLAAELLNALKQQNAAAPLAPLPPP
ncbi:MAG: tetratricopeptide repeat protein [Planctomycetaceae bacterium]|nr:tetratricopeptide repeat protein [Planctomycetaceae bacterium]